MKRCYACNEKDYEIEQLNHELKKMRTQIALLLRVKK